MEVNDLRDFYALWLEGAMAADGHNQSELARLSGIARETIWRILNRKTDADPETISVLSDVLAYPLPSYLMTPERGMVPISNSMADAVADLVAPTEVEGFNFPGWLWSSDGREPEEEFRGEVGNVRLMAILLLGSGVDPLPYAEIRDVRLAICRMAIRGCETAGRSVPRFINDVYNELIENRFDDERAWFKTREEEAEALAFARESAQKEREEAEAKQRREGESAPDGGAPDEEAKSRVASASRAAKKTRDAVKGTRKPAR